MRIIIIIIMTVISLNAQNDYPLDGKCYVIGHRGAPAYGGENTLWGFQKALDLGADGFELDVLPTKDGKLIVGHDFDLHRLIGKEQLAAVFPDDSRSHVTEFTQAELKKLKVTFPAPDEERLNFQKLEDTYRMPTLEEALELLIRARKSKNQPDLKIYIEIKTKENYMHTISLNAISYLVTRAIEEKGLLGDKNVWIQSFDYEMMDIISSNPILAEHPKCQLGFDGLMAMRKFRNSRTTKKFLKKKVLNRQLQMFHMWKVPGKYIYDKKEVDFVHIAHELKLPIHLYTFRDLQAESDYKYLAPFGIKGFETKEEELLYFMSMGVDAVMTDNVTSALEVRRNLANDKRGQLE